MIQRRAVSGLGTSAALFCLLVSAAPPESPALLDPSTGNLGGMIAVAVSPAEITDDTLQVLSPFGFRAHLTSEVDPDFELRYPCGIWFQPPPGRYRVRVEGDWQMSAYSLLLSYSGEPFRGRGLVAAIPVVAAGLVALPSETPVGQDLVLRLLHAGAHLEKGYPRWDLTVGRPTAAVGDGVLMPAGPAIGGLWDRRTERYLALSRPFMVHAHSTVTVPLAVPEDSANLVVQFQRAVAKGSAAEAELDVHLVAGDEHFAPDLMVGTAARLYAVWYDLRPGLVILHATTQHSFLEPQPIELREGRIERIIGRLEAVPEWLR